ncbi:MAG TPA: glycoside hydrolase family 32 protein [Ruminiclostridium sp.]
MNEHQQNILKDIHRQKYHIAAPVGWINDPNGLIQYKGEYHVFYQYHPYSASWGPMHWGHVKSSDLVHWQNLLVAIAPGDDYDDGGCFSGSAVDDDGILTLIYTGNRISEQLSQNQCIATSIDGVHFTKYASNPIIPKAPQEGIRDFRDPKVWKKDGYWYMVTGSKKDGFGQVLLHKSIDLRNWEYIGVAAQGDEGMGDMWECPDLFELEGMHVLITSPMNMKNGKNIYMVGEMDYTSGKFTKKYCGEIDYGFDFYAAQTFLDDKGRRILLAWMDSWGAKSPTKLHGWSGSLTLPRVINLMSDGKLYMQPVPELESLRGEMQETRNILICETDDYNLDWQLGTAIELIIRFDLDACTADEFGIKVRCSKDYSEETVVGYNTLTKELFVDRDKSASVYQSGNTEKGISKCKLDTNDGVIEIHVFMDSSSIEVFGNKGRSAISNRVYPSESSMGMNLFARNGEVKLLCLKKWGL